MVDRDIPFIDDDLAHTPEDIRRDLAELGRNDLFFFSKGILGNHDLTVQCHGPLCTFFDKHPARFKLVLHPRGTFKSTIGTVARSLQRVCRDPESRTLIANETATNAQGFLGAIKQHAESNARFRALYSDVIPLDTRKVPWNQDALTFRRQGAYVEPTISAIGMTGAWTSRHFSHIGFDDPISEDAARSDLVMRDVITRISKVFSLMTDPSLDSFDLTGTRWAFFDVYSHMMEWLGADLARFIRGAVEDGKSIFPERLPLETLTQIRDAPDMGEYLFSCQYMNNPRNPELQDFNVRDLRFWRWSSDESHVVFYNPDGTIKDIVELSKLDVTVTVDLAPAERITSDRNAVLVTGTTPTGEVAILEAWARRCTPLELIEHLMGIKLRYSPRVFGIEDVAYQKAFKYFLRAEADRRSTYLNVVPIKAITKKEIRIRGLQPVAATGHLYISPSDHELRNEFADFPLGKHDDLLDALSMQLQLWRGPVSPERWRRLKAAQERILRDIDGYGVRSDACASHAPLRGKRHPRDIPHPDDLGIEPLQPSIEEVQVA